MFRHIFGFQSVNNVTCLRPAHPEAKPVEGLTVYYTIHFSAYDGSATTAYDVVYDVTGAAQFTPLSCTWWADGKIPE